MHPLNGALPLPYAPVRVTRGALVAHRHTYAPPRCRTSRYSRTFIPLSVSLRNDLLFPYSMVWDWRVSRTGSMLFYWSQMLYPYSNLLLFFPFLLFLPIGWYCGAGVFGLIGCISLSLSIALPTFYNNNNNNNNIIHQKFIIYIICNGFLPNFDYLGFLLLLCGFFNCQ